jgi:pimeloyl-ACP methyl ester carboxylesterase
VVHAALDVSRRFAGDVPMRVAGYSLGGNFALRLALRAPDSGLALAQVAAVCPLLDPATTMDRIESGLPLYDWYFARKWRRSLQRKRSLFPQRHDFDDTVLALDIRALTDWLVQRHTAFGTLEAYFDGYAIAGDRLAALTVPAHILMAEDDPVIPFDTFRDWALPAHATLEIAPWGGHCGFIENAACDGYAERWVAERLSGGDA